MRSHVSTLIPALCKPPMANITLVGAFSRVDSNVLLKLGLGEELLPAHSTVELPVVGVGGDLKIK